MTSGRGLPIPSVLVALVIMVALAILLPDSAQGECCRCPITGTPACSECCYVDQFALCQEYPGPPVHCGCTCVDNPDYWPDDGGCKRLSSRTLVIGSDRAENVGRDRRETFGKWGGASGARSRPDASEAEEELADHQLRFGLLHPGARREGSFNFEEWALVSSAGDKATVLNASTVEFANRVQDVAERFRPRGKGTSTVLVIEDAEHPHNSREIPVPGVAPIDFDAGLPVSAAGQEAWFRAEVGEDGVIDQVMLMNSPEAFSSFWINERLRDHLSLRYADEGRHRVVVFGAVRANARGHLVMTNSWVALPKCCCGGHHCV